MVLSKRFLLVAFVALTTTATSVVLADESSVVEEKIEEIQGRSNPVPEELKNSEIQEDDEDKKTDDRFSSPFGGPWTHSPLGPTVFPHPNRPPKDFELQQLKHRMDEISIAIANIIHACPCAKGVPFTGPSGIPGAWGSLSVHKPWGGNQGWTGQTGGSNPWQGGQVGGTFPGNQIGGSWQGGQVGGQIGGTYPGGQIGGTTYPGGQVGGTYPGGQIGGQIGGPEKRGKIR